jgi:hypothetical protein
MHYRGIEYKYRIVEEKGQFFGVCSFFISTNQYLYVERRFAPEKSASKEQAKKIAQIFSKNQIKLYEHLS